MNVLDINSFYQNRLTLEQMQRTAAGGKSGAKPAVTTSPTPAATTGIDKKSPLYQACQDFESIFIKQMLSVMRKTIQKSGLMEGGMAEEVFEDMLYDEYAKKMAQTAQFGLSEILYKQLAAKNP